MDTLQTSIIDTIYVISKTTSNDAANYYSYIIDVIIIIISSIGVWVAFGGLKTWRKQLRGKTEYDTARKLLLAIYEVRESIRLVRNPIISLGEIQKAFDDENLDFNKVKQDIIVYQKRWKSVGTALSNLNVEALQSEVIWGKDVKTLLDNFRSTVNKLRIELGIFLDLGIKGIREEYGKEKVKEIRDIMYETSDDLYKDDYAMKLNNSIKGIEEFVKEFLKL